MATRNARTIATPAPIAPDYSAMILVRCNYGTKTVDCHLYASQAQGVINNWRDSSVKVDILVNQTGYIVK